MLHILRSIVQAVNEAQELATALNILVSRTKEALVTECCSVYLANYDAQHFLLMASDGLDSQAIGKTAIGFSEGLIGLVGQREEPINLANAHSHPRFKTVQEVKEESLKAFLGTPIIHQRQVLGVLTIQQSQSRQFSEQEESFLVTLAAQLATVLAHAQVKGQLSQVGADQTSSSMLTMVGAAGSPGIAIADAWVEHPVMQLSDVAELPETDAIDAQVELQRWQSAIRLARGDLERKSVRMSEFLEQDVLAIFDVYQQMLDEASLGGAVAREIETGMAAEAALYRVASDYIAQFDAMHDPYLKERGSDVRDVAQRLLYFLQKPTLKPRQWSDQIVLVAEEVTASMLAEVPKQYLKGIVSLKGGTNSHAAILARALGIPAVLGVAELPLNKLGKRNIIIDGYSGRIYVSPTESILDEYQRLLSEEFELNSRFERARTKRAITLDGTDVKVLINTGLATESEHYGGGADGVGLYRTEIPFMLKDNFPSEEFQSQLYGRMLERFKPQPVVMRTLDVGGDKALPYFSTREENPFLGWRGIRMTLDHPEIFLVQIRAMLRANQGNSNLKIMFPMITSITELKEARRLVFQACSELSDEFGAPVKQPEIGVMIEIPAMLYQMGSLSGLVDFVSVGSNDLTQYLLAVDRNNTRVAALYDSLHPAVLNALLHVAKQCQAMSIPFSICGELASDPLGVLLLLGMGYRDLSMNAVNIAKIKWTIRHVRLESCRQLLMKVMGLNDVQEIRRTLHVEMEQMGLGKLLRAGH